ncbi:MAG: class I SAM-dependent methyltransferase [Gemmataceae bacterium]
MNQPHCNRLWLLTVFLALPLWAAGPPNLRYEYRRNHDPDGIGKFYMDREIAWVMSYHGAAWLERPERVKEERTDKLLKLLPIKPGMTVVDMGAGSGYHSFPIAKKVGSKGKVIAVDIQKEMLDIINRRKKALEVTNIETVLGKVDDPQLQADSVDLILMVDVYHEFSHPYEMTKKMVEALKPGGILAFVEFRLEDPNVPIKLVHKMSEKQVIREMKPHPLKHIKTYSSLPWQHLILFEKIKDE